MMLLASAGIGGWEEEGFCRGFVLVLWMGGRGF